MRCPKCTYVLTYSDRLLCRVAGAYYCPRCWHRIELEGDASGSPAFGAQDLEPERGEEDSAELAGAQMESPVHHGR